MDDATQWIEGVRTPSVDSAGKHYYRRLMTDRVRAVDAVAHLPRPTTAAAAAPTHPSSLTGRTSAD